MYIHTITDFVEMNVLAIMGKSVVISENELQDMLSTSSIDACSVEVRSASPLLSLDKLFSVTRNVPSI